MCYPPAKNQLSLLEQICALQHVNDFAPAVRTAGHRQWKPYCSQDVIEQILTRFPPTLIAEIATFPMPQGCSMRALARFRMPSNAWSSPFSYTATNEQIELAVRCSLELAQLYCSREDFQTAYHHLREHVQPWAQELSPSRRSPHVFICAWRRSHQTLGNSARRLIIRVRRSPSTKTNNNLPGQYSPWCGSLHLDSPRCQWRGRPYRYTGQRMSGRGYFWPASSCTYINLDCHYHWYRGNSWSHWILRSNTSPC